VTTLRSVPRGLPVTTAYASSAPATAPARALTADTTTLLTKDVRMNPRPIAAIPSRLGPSGLTNAPITTIAVGSSRNRAT
jgi:hypothetical protein